MCTMTRFTNATGAPECNPDTGVLARVRSVKSQNIMAMERQQLSTSRAYKRSPASSNSTWYKGMLMSQMAGTADNNGAFYFTIAKMRRGPNLRPMSTRGNTSFLRALAPPVSRWMAAYG
jgi:hypothetical protein